MPQQEPTRPTRHKLKRTHLKRPLPSLPKRGQVEETATVKPEGRRPWISPDGIYMNEVAAAQYLGKSLSRLRNMRCQRIGPKFHKPGRSIYYRADDLRDFIEGRSGWSVS